MTNPIACVGDEEALDIASVISGQQLDSYWRAIVGIISTKPHYYLGQYQCRTTPDAA